MQRKTSTLVFVAAAVSAGALLAATGCQSSDTAQDVDPATSEHPTSEHPSSEHPG